MHPLLTSLIVRTTLKKKKADNSLEDQQNSDAEFFKAYSDFKVLSRRLVKDIVLITIGIFSAAFGFKGFLLTNHFIDGGATGISLLLSALTGVPLYMLIIAVNLPFVFLAYRVNGKRFAVMTSLAIAGLAIVLATVTFPNVTDDNLLVAVFGGFFLGAGIGFAIRGGAVIDGTEVLALFISRKFRTTIGDVIIAINVLIFGAAAYFLGVEIALYSMITYMAASKTLDFIVEGIDEYIGVTIVANNSEAIRQMITEKMGRGVTVYKGKGGYGKEDENQDKDVLYTVVTRLELNKLNTEIDLIEPRAFVVMNSVKDTRGGVIKRRPLQH